jgi:hypothetical protein
VTLRNFLVRRRVAGFGETWWLNSEFRRDAHRQTITHLAAAAAALRKRGHDETCARMTGIMSLGFWSSLLRSQVADSLLGADTAHLLRMESTHVTDLRNRIAHHEPSFRRDLLADYSTTMRLLHRICPATHDWIRPYCAIPALVRRKP